MLWVIRIFFWLLCITAGYAVSQYRPEVINSGLYGILIGFGLGGLLIGVDQVLKGFSLRVFSAATFGLALGVLAAWLIDQTSLFVYAEEETRWVIRLGMFLGFGYLGMVLAVRSNKEDFSLIIPYVRFRSHTEPENRVLLDTSAIIDGRIAALIVANFVEGIIVIPRFVLKELQMVADSSDATRRARGRRGLELLNQLQANPRLQINIHEADFPEEKETDAKLLRLARNLGAKLYTTDYNLSKVAQLQSVSCVNLTELAGMLKPVLMPGEKLSLRVLREGKDKGQGVAYLPDGTMVVINQAEHLIGREVEVQISNLVPTGAGMIAFAELKSSLPG